MQGYIKKLQDQFEVDKNQQREEYMRAFNKLKEEMAQMRGSSKGKEDEMSTLRSNLQAKMIENTELQSKLTALQTQLNQILEQNKDIATLSKQSADQQN